PTSIDAPVPDYLAGLSGELSGLRIGVDRLSAVAGEQADPATPVVLEAEIVEVELPLYAEMTTACMVIMVCEALAYHLPDLRTRWSDYFAATRSTVGSGV